MHLVDVRAKILALKNNAFKGPHYMNLQFTDVYFDKHDNKCEITLVNHEDDPPESFTFSFDKENLRVKRGRVVAREDIPHNLHNADWPNNKITAEIRSALVSLKGYQDQEAATHINKAINPLNTVLQSLKDSQDSWTEFLLHSHRSAFHQAHKHLNTALNHANWAGISVLGLNEPMYPPLDQVDAGHHREVELTLAVLRVRLEETVTETMGRLDSAIKDLDDRYSSQEKELTKKMEVLDERVTNATALVDDIKSGIVRELTNEDSEIKELTEERKKLLNEIVEDATNHLEGLKEESRSILDELKITATQFKQLTQEEASTVMVKQFREAANDANLASQFWTTAFFVLGVAGAIVFFVLIWEKPTTPTTSDMGWVTVFGRLSLTAAIAYMLGYSGTQATRQRNAKLYFDRMAIEMVSLDAYLSPYDDATTLEIKTKLMTSYFGKVTAPGYQIEGSAPSLDIVKHFTEAIGARGKGDKEDPKKDGTKGESNMNLSLTLSAKSPPEEQPPKDKTS